MKQRREKNPCGWAVAEVSVAAILHRIEYQRILKKHSSPVLNIPMIASIAFHVDKESINHKEINSSK